MTISSWHDVVPKVLPHVPSCPRAVVEDAIHEAVREFCERSLAWRESLPSISTRKDRSTYDLAPPDASIVVALPYVAYEGKTLEQKSVEALDLEWPLFSRQYPFRRHQVKTVTPWRELTGDQPTIFYQPNPTQIRLVPIPDHDRDKALTLEAALKPGIQRASMPEWLFDQWFETWAAGAIARLKAMRGKPWFDPASIQLWATIYETGIVEAGNRTTRAHAQDNQIVRHTKVYW